MAEDESGFSRRGSRVETKPARSPDREPELPELVDGRYRIEALLGEGGMGRVYRARDLELGETIALKRLVHVTPAYAELLRREVRLARRVTHENVVRVHDLGVSASGIVYLTMELVEGPSLRELLRRGRLETAEARAIAIQISEGLDAAHRAGIVHADLKPANVLLRTHDGRRTAVITDFGIAHAVAETQDALIGAGTPQYMAPEQRRHGVIDARADIYALGLLVFELFAGERLGAAGADLDQSSLVARVREAVPAPLADAIVAAIDPDPDRRPGTSQPFLSALDHDEAGTRTDAATADGTRIAVAPFRVVGRDGEGYLGIGVAEELVRLLSSLPGLTVLGVGAVASDADGPRAATRKLGGRALVEGTVQRIDDRVRVNVGLVDVHTGVQLWGDRIDGSMQDAFAFEEEMAQRICEALRVRWMAVARARPAKPEAVDLYFRARGQLFRGAVTGPTGAVAIAEQCLELAPELEPALALHAIGCCKAWFLPSAAQDRDWGEVSRAAARLAVERAPALSDSHIAAGLVFMQDGDIIASTHAFQRALELAPTSSTAHDYMGRFQLEAGRIDEALEHLTLAKRLDPTLEAPALYIARYHALRGDRSHMEALHASRDHALFPALQLLVRVAAWFGDEVELRRCLERTRSFTVLRDEAALIEVYCRYVLGELLPEQVEQIWARQIPLERLGVRIRSNLHQIMAEGHAVRNARELALRHLSSAAELALIDLDWLAHCPPLAPLRAADAFAEAARATRVRASALLES